MSRKNNKQIEHMESQRQKQSQTKRKSHKNARGRVSVCVRDYKLVREISQHLTEFITLNTHISVQF